MLPACSACLEMLTRFQKDERVRQVEQAKATMNRIGTQLIAEKKAAIAREASEKKGHGGGGQSLQGRDLLTLLIKANMATDIPDNQRLSDADVLSRTSGVCYAMIRGGVLICLHYRGPNVSHSF